MTKFAYILMIIFCANAFAATERKVDADFVQFKQQASAPANPPGGYNRFYIKNDNKVYFRDYLGNEYQLFSSSGVIALADGGTNKSITASAGAIVYSDADSFELTSVGVSGQALISGGAGAPSFYAPTAGSVLFSGASGVLEQDNASLFFDDANNRLGLLTASPNVTLDNAGSFALRFSNDSTAGDVDALSTVGKGAVRLTGAVTNLKGIANGADGKIAVVRNATGGIISIVNESGAVTAANRILTGSGIDLAIQDGGTFIVAYDATSERWNVIGGGGGGLSRVTDGTRASPVAITAAGGISFSETGDEDKYIEGSGGAVDITANPQVEAGTVDGQRLCLIGRSDDNAVLLENGTGLSLNGQAEIGFDDTLCLRWDLTNWVEVSRNF